MVYYNIKYTITKKCYNIKYTIFLYKKRWGIEIMFKKMKQNFQMFYMFPADFLPN
jgi:IS4 transposase